MSATGETQTASSHGNFVAGGSRPSRGGEEYERRNPASPSEVVGRFAASDEYDVEDAVGAAYAAQPAWAATSAPARGRFLAGAARALEARLEQVAQDMTQEMGKPIRE